MKVLKDTKKEVKKNRRVKGVWGDMEGWWQGELCLLRSNSKINAFLFTCRNIFSHLPLPCQVTDLQISSLCTPSNVQWCEQNKTLSNQ